MKVIAWCVLATGLLFPGAGRAEDPQAALHDALDAQASAPSTPPSLPDEASARAKTVQQTVAHKHGAGEQAHDAAASHGDEAADAARRDASSRSAEGAAASAAKNANADSHAAAGQARAAEAHGGKVPGGGNPGHPGGPPPGHPH